MAANPFRSDWLAGGRDERLRPQGTLSYVSGSTDEPLRFITLSQQLDKTVSRHGPRDAAIFDAENLRLSWYDLKQRADEMAAGLLALGLRRGNRVGIWAPNRHEWIVTQFATARIGLILVNINPAYRTDRARVRARQGRLPRARHGATLQGQRLARHARRDRAGDPPQGRERGARQRPPARAQARRPARRRAGAAALPVVPPAARARRAGAARAARCPERRARPRRRDQHPVHERNDRVAEGGDALALQHRQQRALLRQGDGARAGRQALHPGAALPLLRHGARRAVRRRLGRDDGLPGRELRRRRDAALDRAGTAARRCTACRRCSARCSSTTSFAQPRPVVPAHRHHGRRAVPDRDDAQGDRAHAHEPGDDRLRHDGDFADLVPVEPRRPARAPRIDGRPDPAAPRGQDRRRRRPHRPGRHGRRAVHARLRRHARLLEGRGAHARGDRRRRLDAHRRPGDDRCRGLREHRRPRQGHAHPRRRERLSARGRGVPAAPSRRSRTSRCSACPTRSTARKSAPG